MSDQTTTPSSPARQRFLFDPAWRFYLGEPAFSPPASHQNEFPLAHLLPTPGPAGIDFDDHAWRVVDLPHDWAVEGIFDPQAEPNHGSLPGGVGGTVNRSTFLKRTAANAFTWSLTAFSVIAQSGSTVTWLVASPAATPTSAMISAICSTLAARTWWRCAWTLPSSRAGGTKAPGSTGMSGMAQGRPLHGFPGSFRRRSTGGDGQAWHVTVETELANQSDQAAIAPSSPPSWMPAA